MILISKFYLWLWFSKGAKISESQWEEGGGGRGERRRRLTVEASRENLGSNTEPFELSQQ